MFFILLYLATQTALGSTDKPIRTQLDDKSLHDATTESWFSGLWFCITLWIAGRKYKTFFYCDWLDRERAEWTKVKLELSKHIKTKKKSFESPFDPSENNLLSVEQLVIKLAVCYLADWSRVMCFIRSVFADDKNNQHFLFSCNDGLATGLGY